MKANEFVKLHYSDAYAWRGPGLNKKRPTFIWSITDKGQKMLGRGDTEAKAWADAKKRIQKEQFAVTATNPQYKSLQVALAKAAKEIGWKGLTAELASWCQKNQPSDTNYSLPWWCKEIKYDIAKR